MRYLTLFVLLLFVSLTIFLSCSNEVPDDKGKTVDRGITVIVVEGCKYVVYKTSSNYEAGVAMVHAGNCNNIQHVK